jgi:hypothetical protein
MFLHLAKQTKKLIIVSMICGVPVASAAAQLQEQMRSV